MSRSQFATVPVMRSSSEVLGIGGGESGAAAADKPGAAALMEEN